MSKLCERGTLPLDGGRLRCRRLNTMAESGETAARSSQGSPARERGVTLLEALVVIAIIGLALTVTIPNLQRARVRAVMLGEVNQVAEAIAVARISAIRRGEQVVITVPPGAGTTLVAIADSDGDGIFEAGDEELRRWLLSGRITVTGDAVNPLRSVTVAGSARPSVQIRADGIVLASPANDGTGFGRAVFSDVSGNQVRLTVNSGTGTVQKEMRIPETSSWSTELRYWRF